MTGAKQGPGEDSGAVEVVVVQDDRLELGVGGEDLGREDSDAALAIMDPTKGYRFLAL